jgi:CRP/FNR family transcriptional regulator, cyclic AMP receptor protein
MIGRFFGHGKQDLSRLVEVITANKSDETLGRKMPAHAWDALATHVSRKKLKPGEVLIAQGALDRTLYFVESGVLRVHYGTRNGELEIAVVGPGAVVGEGAFFSQVPRNATVVATQATVLWALTPARFEALATENCEAALALSMALGAVLATRMSNVSRKIAVT